MVLCTLPLTVPGLKTKQESVAVTGFTQRRTSEMQMVDSPETDIITIENTLAEHLESPMHHYDLPSELASAGNIHHMPWTNLPREKYVNIFTDGSPLSESHGQLSKTYDSARELGTVSRSFTQSTAYPLNERLPTIMTTTII